MITKENADPPEATDEPENEKELRQLNVGEIVMIQNEKTKCWDRKAEVISIDKNKRSYCVETIDDLQDLRRNRRFLRPTTVKEKPEEQSDKKSEHNNQLERMSEKPIRRSERIKARNAKQQ